MEHARAIQNTNTRLPVVTHKIVEPSYSYGTLRADGRNSAVDLGGSRDMNDSFLIKKYGSSNSIYASHVTPPRSYQSAKFKGLNNSISA